MIQGPSSSTAGPAATSPARPAAAGLGLVAGHPRHLASQDRTIEQEAGLLLLDDLEPCAARAWRLVVGISRSRSGTTILRRRQKCGWMSTGWLVLPSARISHQPVVWSGSARGCIRSPRSSRGSTSAAHVLDDAVGLVPVSNSKRCDRPALTTVTSIANRARRSARVRPSAIGLRVASRRFKSARLGPLVRHENVGDVVDQADQLGESTAQRDGGKLELFGQGRRRAVLHAFASSHMVTT